MFASTEVSNHNVFILGAGFSREAGAPLIHDFLDMSREFFDDPDSHLDKEERSQFREVFEFKKRVSQAREKFRIDLDNIEELFGLVEMSHRLGSGSAETRDAIVYLITKTLQLAVGRRQRRDLMRIGHPRSAVPKSTVFEQRSYTRKNELADQRTRLSSET